MSLPLHDNRLKREAKVENFDDPVARENFRVVIIKPEEVEQCDISDPATANRKLYKYDPKSVSWKMEELWP